MQQQEEKHEPSAAIATATTLIHGGVRDLMNIINDQLTEVNQHAIGLIDLSNGYVDELEKLYSQLEQMEGTEKELRLEVAKLQEELTAKAGDSIAINQQIEELESELIEHKVSTAKLTAKLEDLTKRHKTAIELAKLQEQELKKLKELDPLRLSKKNKELKEHNAKLKDQVKELEKKAREMTFTDNKGSHGAGGLMSVGEHVKNALSRAYPRNDKDRKNQHMMLSRSGNSLAESLKHEVNRLRQQILAPAPLLNSYLRANWLYHFGKPYQGSTEDSSWNVYAYESAIQSNVVRAIKGLYFGLNLVSSRGLCGLVIFGEFMEMGIAISGSVAVLPEQLIEDGYNFLYDMIKYTHPSIVQRAKWLRTISTSELGLKKPHCELITASGMPTLWHLVAAPVERLAMLKGIGVKTAEDIRAKALAYISEHWKKEVKLEPEITFIESVIQIAENCEISAQRQLQIATSIDNNSATPDERLIFDILVTNVNPKDFFDMAIIEELEKQKQALKNDMLRLDQEKANGFTGTLPADIARVHGLPAPATKADNA